MITLDIQEYCHECRDFEADVEKPERLITNDGNTVTQSDTVIRCERRNRCASIKRYLERIAEQKAFEEANHQAIEDALRKMKSGEAGGKFTNRCRDI